MEPENHPFEKERLIFSRTLKNLFSHAMVIQVVKRSWENGSAFSGDSKKWR